MMKKVLAAVLCLALALNLAACGAKTADTSNNHPAEDEQTGNGTMTDGVNAQLANPFVEYGTLAEAEQAAGYSFAVPETMDGYPETFYSVMNGGELLQVIYRSDDDELIARKAPGDGDISGDYRSPETSEGDPDRIYSAQWTVEEGCSYSVVSLAGMEPDLFNAFVNSIVNGESLSAEG